MSIVKRIDLTDQQMEKCRQDLHQRESIGKLLAETMLMLTDKLFKSENVAWDEAARIAGYADMNDLHRDGKAIRISWVRQCIEMWQEDEQRVMDDELDRRDVYDAMKAEIERLRYRVVELGRRVAVQEDQA